MKSCSICKLSKDKKEFYKKTSSKDGLHPYCTACMKKRNAEYYLNNTEQCKFISSTWKIKNRERARELNEISRQRNLHSLAAKEARRRATKRNATPVWGNKFIISEAYHLAALRTKLTGINWEVDHIVPLISNLVCGLHVENNLRVIPAKLNRKKSNVYWPEMPV